MPYRIEIPVRNTPTVPYYSVPYRIYGGDINTMTLFPALVYKVLEPLGLTVVGGLVSDVGVGGFLLGGEFREML
jgi:hypothetical protein